ncbi:hemerythrin domain-containing protein [Streptomyces sp. NBC_01362]|uniref:hemerythrin domain-containing protein n=2 Tax=Streptomyces TaxID=1883 RepID=UPI002E301495|nr:hemerythrin domain-containing protein [Streptomyces sp. NBC_01362]
MEPGAGVIVELAADHRELEALFEQIELQPVDHPRRRELADRLTAELVRHCIAEELHFYPTVRKHVLHDAALADKGLADHARAEQMRKGLEDLSVDDPLFNDTIAKLKFEVASHVREEEHELFPKLAATLPPEKLDELSRMVRRARETAPTRPHPLLPNTLPAHRTPRSRNRFGGPGTRSAPHHHPLTPDMACRPSRTRRSTECQPSKGPCRWPARPAG